VGNVFAQNAENYVISGQIVDSLTNEPIAFATAKIVDKQSFKIVKAVAADDAGRFSITINSTGDFAFVAEFIGKRTKSIDLSILENQKNVDLGKIQLDNESTQLAEVQVIAAKPLVLMDIDKIIYDLQADPESATNNVLDMLRKVPLVTVDGDDNIQLKGESNFKIYINGKLSNMVSSNPKEVLKSMPASSIKTIEVITEPGAKYDAEGVGGIINIVTNSVFSGYVGSVNARIDSRGSFGGGGYFSTKIGKFGLSANIFGNKRFDGEGSTFSSQENLDTAVINNSYRFRNSNSTSKRKQVFYYGNVELTYEIDSLNLISVSGGVMTGNYNNYDLFGKTFMFNESSDTVSGYQTRGSNFGTWGGINLGANYQRSFHKKDRLLTFSYQFDNSPNDSENQSVIENLPFYPTIHNPAESDRILTTNGATNEHTFQIDYTEPFGKKHVIETGAKYILRLNASDNDYRMRDTLQNSDAYIPDNSQKDNDLNYTQNILGVYGSYTFKIEKFSVRGGLRFERTASAIHYPNSPERNFNARPFANLIPSIVMNYKPNMSSNFRLNYTQSIRRPGISYLNPFVDDSNPFQIQQGNPDLKPEITNSFSFAYTFFTQKFNLNTYGYSSFTNNSINEITSMAENKEKKYVIKTTYENIGLANWTGIGFYVNWSPTAAIRLYANSSANYSYFYFSKNDATQEKDGFSYSIWAGAQFSLPLAFRINANGGYYTPQISFETQTSPYYFHSLGVSKEFFKKKLNVSLRLQEPFRKNQKYDMTTFKEDVYKMQNIMTYPARRVELSVNFRFGEMKEQIKKIERGIQNDDVKSGGGASSSGGSSSGQSGGQ
jgi:outer membrane receptor protein involved in Fe transport